jgi:hypothetical protein
MFCFIRLLTITEILNVFRIITFAVQFGKCLSVCRSFLCVVLVSVRQFLFFDGSEVSFLRDMKI